MDFVLRPRSVQELLERARNLSGLSLRNVVEEKIFSTTKPHKGWMGELIEMALGLSQDKAAEPDFQEYGIELKTIPISVKGLPKESTFICSVPASPELSWETSAVRKKLLKILWIPLQVNNPDRFLERRIGEPYLWSPSPEQEKIFRQDWEELMESFVLGEAEALTARQGQALQLRPKALNSRKVKAYINSSGKKCWITPRGFYLRSQFTCSLFQEKFKAF